MGCRGVDFTIHSVVCAYLCLLLRIFFLTDWLPRNCGPHQPSLSLYGGLWAESRAPWSSLAVSPICRWALWDHCFQGQENEKKIPLFLFLCHMTMCLVSVIECIMCLGRFCWWKARWFTGSNCPWMSVVANLVFLALWWPFPDGAWKRWKKKVFCFFHGTEFWLHKCWECQKFYSDLKKKKM